jgi:YDG domain
MNMADTITGGAAGNYTLTQPTVTGAITAKALTVTGSTVTSKTYDGTTTATVNTIGILSGFIGSQMVTARVNTAYFDTANVGTGKTVTVSYILADGANGGLASNYSLANTTTTADITAATASAITPAAASIVTATSGAVVQIAREVISNTASLQSSTAIIIAAAGKEFINKLIPDEGNSSSWLNAPTYRSQSLGSDFVIRGNKEDTP